MIYINQFFFNIFQQLKKIYLNSNFYDKKISNTDNQSLKYKPSPHLFFSLLNIKKKIIIEDFDTDKIWENNEINLKEFKKLNNFYWFFSLDLKSSKKKLNQLLKLDKIIINLIIKVGILISQQKELSPGYLVILNFEGSDKNYNDEFNKIIKKQTNHLISEINRSELFDDKLIGCAAIILVGLCYQK